MKLFIIGLCAILFSLNVQASEPTTNEARPGSITIGVIPGGNPENLRVQSLALAKELQAKLGIPVNFYISKNYVGLVEAMKAKKVDFAFFSSMTYVFAEEQAKAKVLLKKVWQGPYYYSAIITSKKSKIRSLKDLRGQRVAFVDEKSSSGYLYPKVALRQLGLQDKDLKEVIFSGNHQASVQYLDSGKADAVAVYTDDEKGLEGAWTQFGTKKPSEYRVVWMSSPIPNEPFCVRQDFYDLYPKATHSLMFALIDLNEGARNKDTYSEILGSRDLMPATSKQYDPVREMVKALNLELAP